MSEPLVDPTRRRAPEGDLVQRLELEQTESRVDRQALMAQLTERQWAIVALTYVGLSADEIATQARGSLDAQPGRGEGSRQQDPHGDKTPANRVHRIEGGLILY